MSYVLLQRQNMAPRTPIVGSVAELLPDSKLGQLWAVDFETKGLHAWHPDFEIVTVGMADQDGCFSFDWRELTEDEKRHVLCHLNWARLVAFNTYFDAAALRRLNVDFLDDETVFSWIGCAYALFKQLSTEGWQGQSWSLETAQRDVLGWPTTNKSALISALKERGLSKDDMWQLPHEIVGPYCASDADAAWQLWNSLQTLQMCNEHSRVMDYHTRIFMPQLRLMVEQVFRGIAMDLPQLAEAHTGLEGQISNALAAFEQEPSVHGVLAAQFSEETALWRACEPAKLTKSGSPAVAWMRWRDKEPKKVSFNFNSKPQLCDLFYRRLGYRPTKRTATGRPVLDKKVLPLLGEPGKLLANYNMLIKRRGYVARVLERSVDTGILRPGFNMVGTVTGRLSGSGGLNLQQMPKDKALMQCFRARPGHSLVQLDFAALEPTLLAEFSQDATLLDIYGPNAKPNQDIYLYIAAKIPALGKEIVKYYNPDAPTAEGLAEAKKKCKRDRGIAKTVHLASAYGAGAPKIHETLSEGGVNISLAEVKQIHTDYWRLFRGVKRFETSLLSMHAATGGWIPNVLGRPICVDKGYIKDIVNRMIQSSGHDCLQLFITNLARLRQERGLDWNPWILDMHDECIVEVLTADASAVAQSFIDALAAVNEELAMGIPLKGDPMIAQTWADIKIEG